VAQPRSCGAQYLTPAARQVYNPVYYWFYTDPTLLMAVMSTFSREVGVGVLVTDELGTFIGIYDPYNGQYSSTNTVQGAPFWIERTWSLNVPTFNQALLDSSIFSGYTTPFQVGMISQVVINVIGEMRVISIFAPWSAMPLVC